MRRPALARLGPLLAALLGLVATSTDAPARAEAARPGAGPRPVVAYEPPLPGRVLRRFEPPSEPWAVGHRGTDLAAVRGDPVRSAADGVVAFVGVVARERWLSVDHPDGVRTSYGPLDEVAVRAGSTVRRGDVIATVDAGHHPLGALHWGARRRGTYIDPLALLEATTWRPALVDAGGTVLTDIPEAGGYAPWHGRRGLRGALGLVEDSPIADPSGDGYLLPPNPNRVIGVSGFGSSTDLVPLDLTQIGYPEGAITYLSYAGRRADRGGVRDPRRDQLPYDAEHTFLGVHHAALRLREQLRAEWRHHPGRAVDLVGYSMGGVVVAYYLTTMHEPADPDLPPIGHVATIASPLAGSDLASAGLAAGGHPLTLEWMMTLAGLAGQPIPDPAHDQAPHDLAVGSEVSAALLAAWDEAVADRYAGPLATGTQVLTVGGSRDWVVPTHRTRLPGADHVVLPGGHDRVRLTEASRLVLRAFLAGEPVPGEAGGLGHTTSYGRGALVRTVGEILGRLGSPVEP